MNDLTLPHRQVVVSITFDGMPSCGFNNSAIHHEQHEQAVQGPVGCVDGRTPSACRALQLQTCITETHMKSWITADDSRSMRRGARFSRRHSARILTLPRRNVSVPVGKNALDAYGVL